MWTGLSGSVWRAGRAVVVGAMLGTAFAAGPTSAGVAAADASARSTEGNGASFEPVTSATGRYVAYTSLASNLVPGDTNGVADVFLHDMWTGTTQRVSVSGDGEQADAASSSPSPDATGRYVAFLSAASNLVDGDSNYDQDAFVHDTWTGTTERVSVSSDGVEANENVEYLALSPDSRSVLGRRRP